MCCLIDRRVYQPGLEEVNFETCDCSHTNSCLCLPTSSNGCELSCFVDGFQRMKETLKVDNRVKRRIIHIHQSLQMLQNIQCTNLLSCSEPCHPNSTGNIKEFLTVVETTFQQVIKQKGGKK
ncbi:interleukin-9 isoform X2 [Emydura macquarii macquarii]|uniref:interleukin-9 isoform X2 n=1 Tax=Emydura macquarii macquarii TaxID=1129001 RepID=UPI00352A2D33